MSTEKVRIGFIGVGQIGKQHVEAYSKLPHAELVALADLNDAEGRRVADLYGIPHVYTDFRKLLERDDIDAVDVCLHNNFHMPITVAALEAGKHVYCEKPMAGSYVDAETMLKTARATGKMLHIQTRNLYLTETKVAKKLIDEGHLGQLYHARSVGHRRRGRPFVDGYGTPTFVQKRNSGGGALYDMGVYHINTILHLIGNPTVERISGKTYQETPMDARREEISGYDVEELGLGFVRLAENPEALNQVRIDRGKADAVIGCDVVVSSAPKASAHYHAGTRMMLNLAEMPTGDLVLNRDAGLKVDARVAAITQVTRMPI